MAARLIVSTRAGYDIEAISDYISRSNPSAAIRWAQAIRDKCEFIAEMPLAGRRHGERFRRIGEGNSQIIYLVEPEDDPEVVIIVAIIHGARDVYRLFPVD